MAKPDINNVVSWSRVYVSTGWIPPSLNNARMKRVVDKESKENLREFKSELLEYLILYDETQWRKKGGKV